MAVRGWRESQTKDSMMRLKAASMLSSLSHGLAAQRGEQLAWALWRMRVGRVEGSRDAVLQQGFGALLRILHVAMCRHRLQQALTDLAANTACALLENTKRRGFGCLIVQYHRVMDRECVVRAWLAMCAHKAAGALVFAGLKKAVHDVEEAMLTDSILNAVTGFDRWQIAALEALRGSLSMTLSLTLTSCRPK